MKFVRIATTRRYLGYFAAAVVFAIACVLLSNWQVARWHEAQAANDLVAKNFNGTPTPIADVLPTLTSYTGKDEWRQVTVTGTYLIDDQLLVRNRPLDGNPGFEVLVPLKLAGGDVFVVDRGFVPTGNKHDAPDSIPEPRDGTVTVTVRLQASEASDGRSAASGEITTIHLPAVAKAIGEPTYTRAYGLLVDESPAAATNPLPQPEPVLDEGLHVSYAIQWILFALMGFFGLGYAIRNEYRIRNADDPEEKKRAEERLQKKLARPRSDSEVEDEALDRAGA